MESVTRVPRATAVGYVRGIAFALRGFKFVYSQHLGLVRFWIFPLILTLGAIAVVTWLGIHYHDALVSSLWSEPTGDGFGASALRFLHGFVELLAAVVLVIAGTLAVLMLTNLIAAPFNDALSEEVERLATGREPAPFSLSRLLADMVRTIRVELTKLLVYLLVMVPLFVLSLAVPVVGQVVYTVFGFVFTAMYFAIDYVDWPASRRALGVRYRANMARRYFPAMFGFGSAVWLLLLVPILNLFLMPAAVAGGTLLYLELEGSDAAPQPVVV